MPQTMRPPSQLFILFLFTFWGPHVLCQSAEGAQDACAIIPKSIVNDACASYATLERLNERIQPALDDLTRTTDFFSYYRLNLFHKKCPFWDDENGMCGNIACAVETLDDENDIPEVWRASELGKLEGPSAKHPGRNTQKAEPQRPLRGKLGEDVGESCVVEYDDEYDERDYCVPDDESATSRGDYVSLLRNPERFTGYGGDGAHQVWTAIYLENCFQKSSFPHANGLGQGASLRGAAAMDFRLVIEAARRQQILEQQRESNPSTPFVVEMGLEHEDECLEKRVFYKIISGMHASISTHLCWDFLNQTTGEWQPNLQCYFDRLHTHPDRISNLYFNYALLTRAVTKLGPFIAQIGEYTFCIGNPDQDATTRAKVLEVAKRASSVPQIFDESLMFKNGEGPYLKEDFRNRFRNVSRLMDCVGCDKCRLWGKLQTAGYGTALKVLFEFDNNETPEMPLLKRTELVAMFNTYARLSSSLSSITKFRAMVEEGERVKARKEVEKENRKAQETESAGAGTPYRPKKPHRAVASTAIEAAGSKETDEGIKEEERAQKPLTVREEFNKELKKVWRAYKLVLTWWVRTPKVIYRILTFELKRFWRDFLGLPVGPRTWSLEWPNLDEL